MPCFGATSRLMYSISDCSAALPSLVATTSVAPGISLADLVSEKNNSRPATTATTTTTSPAAIHTHRRRFLISNPWLSGLSTSTPVVVMR